MSAPTATPPLHKGARTRRVPRCCACCVWVLAVPVVAALGLWAFMAYRARWEPVPIPTHAVPSPNARDDFLRAYSLFPKERRVFPNSMPLVEEETYEMYRLAAEDAGPALAELRKGLVHEYGAPPRRDAFGPAPLDAHAKFRELARTLSGMARYHELNGRYAQATDCLLDGMEVAAIMDRGGGLIAFLVGSAIEAISTHPMEHILPKLSASGLAHVAVRLETIEGKVTPFADVLREEGYASAAIWQESLRQFDQAGPRQQWDTLRFYGGWPPRDARTVRGLLAMALADRPSLIREHMRYYEAVAEAARRPFAGSLRQGSSTLDGMYGIAGTLDLGSARDASRRACRAVLRTEVALLRYRA
ncbi:MAG: hypothetical protein FJX72_14120, partial [Armatimonadetes bacterium]|nr:hypothetical protein [Armatimonadota bacterium]